MSKRTFKDKLKIKINGFVGPLPKPKTWLFIVGCYNSGTTLLHDLLKKHPEIGSLPSEGQFYTDQFLLPQEENLPRLWAISPHKFCLKGDEAKGPNPVRVKRQWGALFDDTSKPVLVEKSPTNAGRILWLNKHFTNAHFIGIVRNGYAVSEGIKRKAGHDIEKTALQWYRSNNIMLNDLDKVKDKMIITYESLTRDPNDWYSKILKFVGLEAIDVNLQKVKMEVHERNTHIKNMNEKSFSNLSRSEIDTIRRIGESLLDEFDYSIPRKYSSY